MTEISIARSPISHAWLWFKNGLRMLRAQPLTLCITTAWLMLALLLVMQVPVVGPMLAALVWPVLSFGMAEVSQKIRLQNPVSPLDVFVGFHPAHRLQLLTVGAFLAVLLFASLMLMRQFDLSPLMQFSQNLLNQSEKFDTVKLLQTTEAALANPEFAQAAQIVNTFTLINMGIITLLAYAPLFVAWQKAQPVQAIGLSLWTIGRNVLPLGALLLLILGTVFVVVNLLFFLVALVPLLAVWIVLPVVFLLIGFVFALVFTSYHNILTNSTKKS
ncbi:MAG: BPSS1780 family membrane protein [Formosimonas sp.]